MVKDRFVFEAQDVSGVGSDSTVLAFNITEDQKMEMAEDAWNEKVNPIAAKDRQLFVQRFDIIVDALRGRKKAITRENILLFFKNNFATQ